MSTVATAQAALAAAVALRDELVDSGATYTVPRVERLIANVRVDLQASVVALRSEFGVAGHDAVDALIEVGEALLAIGDRLNSGRSRLVTWQMPVNGNAALAAHLFYGDISRRHQIVSINELADPNRIAAGTQLQVFER